MDEDYKDCRFEHFVGYVTETILELNGKLPGYDEWEQFKIALDCVKTETTYVTIVNQYLITVNQFRDLLKDLILLRNGKIPTVEDWVTIKDMMDSVGPDQILQSTTSASSYYNYGATTTTTWTNASATGGNVTGSYYFVTA